MVGQYGLKFGFVFGKQEIFQSTCRKFGESIIRRREHGEGSVAAQSVDQVGSCEGRCQVY